jgi:uncharacterized protein YcbX
VSLAVGEGIPHDRRFAIARGDTGFDPGAPRWLPTNRFVVLKRDAAIARLSCRVDVQAGTIALADGRAGPCVARFANAPDRERLDDFLNAFLGRRSEGRVRLVEAGALSFTDVPENCLSLIHLESVRELESRMGRPVDPLRFRGNVHLTGGTPWEDLGWLGRHVRLGDVTVRVMARIPRCAATGVDPASGERNLNVVKALQAEYGHVDMGLYAAVVGPGRLAVGDPVRPPDDAARGSRVADRLRFLGFVLRNALVVLRSRARAAPPASA